MRSLILILFSVFTFSSLNAQLTSVRVSVFNDRAVAVESATVEAVRAKDSVLVRTALTDAQGRAEINQLPAGDYRLRISAVGFATHYTALFSAEGDKEIGSVTLTPREASMTGVTVTARKPFLQKLSDRIVVNVENSIVSAGSSAMEVLERSPGVTVDQNDVISLRGRSGVIIMIDGKPTAMSGSDLANYLKSLPSSAIERIDLITNPSAKYDAAGNSGIIDIRMKKDQRMGTNGTLTAGYGQGVYPKANAGMTFNYRNKKINIFGNHSYSYRIGLNHLLLDRNFFENGVYNGGDLKDNYAKSPFGAHTSRIGLDYSPSAKTIVGFVVNGNFNHYTRRNNNSTTVLSPQHEQVSRFNSFASNNDHATNWVANINFKHRFDSTGRELTADLDYGEYDSKSITSNSTKYYKLDNSPLQPDYRLDGNQRGKLTFKTGRIDYVNPMRGQARFEAGVKSSFVSSDNDARFYDVSSGTAQNDVNKTNHFLYHENNQAGYINFSKVIRRWDLQVGLRGEQTNINTEQKIGAVRFDSSYFQLFPSAFINYKLKEDQTLGLSVSRRIDRPGYAQLNPFLFLIDVTTYATGRPGLLPQLTWSYEMSYTVKNFHVTAGYSHTRHDQNITLARFREVFPNIPSADNVTVQVPINLSSSDYIGLTLTVPVRINAWWNMINNGNLYYQHYNGAFSGTTLDKGKPAADIRTNNTFTFKKGWAAELNASLNTGGQSGFMVMDPQWSVSTGVQKSLWKNRATVRFNITDIFWTNLPKAVITYTNYIEKWHAYRETRVANLNFTYRFGNNKVQAARRRTTASEEERQRAQ